MSWSPEINYTADDIFDFEPDLIERSGMSIPIGVKKPSSPKSYQKLTPLEVQIFALQTNYQELLKPLVTKYPRAIELRAYYSNVSTTVEIFANISKNLNEPLVDKKKIDKEMQELTIQQSITVSRLETLNIPDDVDSTNYSGLQSLQAVVNQIFVKIQSAVNAKAQPIIYPKKSHF